MLQPLLLTLLGASGTALGGLLVVVQPQLSAKRLGVLQGLAAGLMLSISLCDLLPEAAAEIGVLPANLCFYAGVALFAAIVALIPEPQLFSPPAPAAPGVDAASTSSSSSLPGDTKGSCLLKLPAAAAEAQQSPRQAGGMRQRSVGGGAAAAQLPPGSPAAARLDTSCGGAGSDQQQHLQPLLSPQQQQQHLGPPSPGSADSADLQVVLKYDGKPGSSGGGAGAGAGAAGGGSRSSSTELERREKQQLLMSGVVTAVGIALHNFPEGVAVFLASQKSTAVGVSLACAIALHNIPEGVAVAVPVYAATGSRWRGLQTAVLSGLAEPAAVLLLGLFFPYLSLNKHVVDGMLAGVGGIMAFLAFNELLPLALQHAGKPAAVGSLFMGMAIMSFTLHVLNTHLLAGLH